MIWGLLLFLLSLPAHSTNDNDLPDQPDLELRLCSFSHIGASSTENSDQTSRNIPFYDLFLDKTVICNPRKSLDLFPQSPAYGTASCPSTTSRRMVWRQPNGQLSFSSMLQGGARSTVISDQGHGNVGYFPNNIHNVVSGSQKRKSVGSPMHQSKKLFLRNDGTSQNAINNMGIPGISEVQVTPVILASTSWPQTKFYWSDREVVSKAPLIALEAFVNSRRNNRITNVTWSDIRDGAVIAIGKYLQHIDDHLPNHEVVLTPQTRQIAEFIVGNYDGNNVDETPVDKFDKDLKLMYDYVSTPQFSPITNFGQLRFSPWVEETFSIMSISFRRAYFLSYHHPLLSMVWNACVKLIEMCGIRRDQYMEFLKAEILSKSKNNLEPCLHKNLITQTGLNQQLALVLALMSKSVMETAGRYDGLANNVVPVISK
uniref:Uncharacterized protein n=1 Tax=Spongospora subterranea TaxID=70186 RepID=A0A0H5QUY0_9EUKA|eukprot:CRZ05567.1 hypothetical protein [Spongospora subterranea]